MKGVILAGGIGSRLHPLTKVTNKHLLPVFNKPMIYYPLEILQSLGITSILIISGRDHAEHFIKLFGSGKEYGVKLQYAVQDEAGGIAQALGLAEDFAGESPLAVILGDNIFEGCDEQLRKAAEEFRAGNSDIKLFFKERDDAHRFGVATIEDGKLIKIVEKPKNPETKLAQVGFYLCKPIIFDHIKTLKPSARGELEMTDLNNIFVEKGTAGYEILEGEWFDTGTLEGSMTKDPVLAEQDAAADMGAVFEYYTR